MIVSIKRRIPKLAKNANFTISANLQANARTNNARIFTSSRINVKKKKNFFLLLIII